MLRNAIKIPDSLTDENDEIQKIVEMEIEENEESPILASDLSKTALTSSEASASDSDDL